MHPQPFEPGGDEAYLVTDGALAGADEWATAKVLAAALEQAVAELSDAGLDVHKVAANAPHFVLPLQNSAAIISGDKAAKPENAYWIASSKIVSGACKATT